MNRKPTFADSLRNFIEGKGFYVLVLICVAAIGVSGFYLLGSVGQEENPAAPVSGGAQVTVTPSPSPSSPPASPSPSPSSSAPLQVSAPPAQTTQPSPSPSQEQGESQPPAVSPEPAPTRTAALVYTWPVKGELLADFSLETLAYDVTMGDWRTHSGIDIAAAAGTTVLAAADGTVCQIYDDDLMGTTVVIDHGEGVVSSYSNLQAVPTVAEGDSVSTGSVIGAVGDSAIAESGRASHLHFELVRDGAPVDPEQYLPTQR